MRRKLELRKETLAELTARDLVGVAGAQATPNCPYPKTIWCETLRPVHCPAEPDRRSVRHASRQFIC